MNSPQIDANGRMPRSYSRDYFWNTLGMALTSFVSLVLMVIVTRINGIIVSGFFTYAFSLCILIFTVAYFGGRTYQVSDTAGEFTSSEYVSLKYLTAGGAIIVAAAVVAIGGYDPTLSWLIVLLAGMRIIEAVADPLFGVMQTNGRLDFAGMSMTLKAVIGIAVFTVVDLVTKSVLLASAGLVAVGIVVLLTFDYPIANRLEKLYLKPASFRSYLINTRKILGRSTYVFMYAFLGSVIINIPRFYMGLYHPDMQGFYGIIVMPATMVALFVGFLVQPKIVHLTELYANRKFGDFNRMVLRISLLCLLFGVVATIATYFVGIPVIDLIYGIAMDQYRISLTLAVLGGTLFVIPTIMMSVLVVMRKLVPELIVYIAATIVTGACGWYLIQHHAVEGGIWLYLVTAGTEAVLFVVTYAVLLNKDSRKIREPNDSQ